MSATWSLPVRGAWIEMVCESCTGRHSDRRSPCGERGLKFENAEDAIRETKQVAPRAGSVD